MLQYFAFLLSSILVTIMLFMSRHNSSTSSGTSQEMSRHKNSLLRIVLSSDFHYAITFIYLLQHFFVSPSHIMSRQSFKISRHTLNFQLEFNLSLLQHITACCDTTLGGCFELLLRHYEIMLRHSEIMSRHFFLSHFLCFSC